MQTIKCPDCGNVSSTETKICPNCGYVFDTDENNTTISETPQAKSSVSATDESGTSAQSCRSEVIEKWIDSSFVNKILAFYVRHNGVCSIVLFCIAAIFGVSAYMLIKNWNTGDVLQMALTYSDKLAAVKTCVVFCVIFVALFLMFVDNFVQLRMKNYLIRSGVDYKSDFERLRNSLVYVKNLYGAMLYNDYCAAVYVCENRQECKYIAINAAVTVLLVTTIMAAASVCAIEYVENYMMSMLKTTVTGIDKTTLYTAVIVAIAIIAILFVYSVFWARKFKRRLWAWIDPKK